MPLPREHNAPAQEATISSIPEANRRIFSDAQRPLRIPRQDSSSPTRQLTTIRAEDETPAMISPTSSRRGPTPEHLPPPLWHSEADMEMSSEDDEPTPAPWTAPSTSQNNAPPYTKRPVASRSAHEISEPPASPNKTGQPAQQERSAVAISQDHVLRSPTATSDPRLRRPIVHQPATDNSNVNSQRPTDKPSVGRDLRLITPSSSKEAPQAHELPSKPPAPFAPRPSTVPSDAPSRDHQDQVKIPSSVNHPAKPSVNPNMHAQTELDTMLQESRSINQNGKLVSEPNFDRNPLAGRSYGPPRDRAPPNSGTEQSSDALGLVAPQDATLHGGHPRPQPSPLPALTSHSPIVPDQGRKRGRTGDDFDHQTAGLPPSKRHQTEPTALERDTEVHHQADKSLYAKPVASGSSEFHEPREAGVSRGRGYGLTPRGPKHNVVRKAHERVGEDRASRPGYDRDYRDSRHYEDDTDYSRHYDRFDRQVDQRPEPYESRNRRSPSDYREYDTASRDNRTSHSAYRRYTPDREQHTRAEPRSPRGASERQQDGWSYRDVGRDRYYRYGDSGGPGSMDSYHALRYDSRARSLQPRDGDIRCGTMGVAITSGVLASLDSRATTRSEGSPERQSASASGTSTPTLLSAGDAAIPSRFIACVSRQESARKLRRTFGDLGPSGQAVEVVVGDNLQAIQESDVVILCCKPQQAQNILSLSGVKEALDKKLLISILAGVTISQLEEW
ncbi:delta 1-pyrroline-5-carboxylate reductase, partial [Tulasnella sp. 408]